MGLGLTRRAKRVRPTSPIVRFDFTADVLTR
jgi:hypothetical protein